MWMLTVLSNKAYGLLKRLATYHFWGVPEKSQHPVLHKHILVSRRVQKPVLDKSERMVSQQTGSSRKAFNYSYGSG